MPLALSSVVIFLMALIYIGSVVDPTGHLRGLPVLLIDQDRGASLAGRQVDFGAAVSRGLDSSAPVAERLDITTVTWHEAERQMNEGGDYAAVDIPTDFTSTLLALDGFAPFDDSVTTKPTITLWTNQRLGTLGTSLATGVLQPALNAVSHDLGTELLMVSPGRSTSAIRAQIASPVTVPVVVYRPLPSHSALGLSAFYISLLALMCGFLGATIINSSVDSSLGYAAIEVGPDWSQRRPVAITRWQTLLAKWAMSAALVPVLTGLVVLGAVGILRMDAPAPLLLWLFISLAAISVAFATLVLFAALGTPGQLVALLIFVYLALASSGGTVPPQALSPFFQFSAKFEPLRQILDGSRALLYFNGQLDAGLGHSLLVIVVELLIWIVLGCAVTLWYDRKGWQRMAPETLEYVNRSVDQYLANR